MKKLLITVALSMLAPCAANAQTHYIVHFHGSTQAYICVACSLSTPFPDPKTLDTINAWMEGKPPFADSKTHQGVAYSLRSGDILNVCNGCGCARYIMDHDGLWTEGTFQATRSYPATSPAGRGNTNTAPSKVAS
jgi:hypothetical protein